MFQSTDCAKRLWCWSFDQSDPALSIVEMLPRIYILRSDPTTQKGREKDTRDELPFPIAKQGNSSKTFKIWVYVFNGLKEADYALGAVLLPLLWSSLSTEFCAPLIWCCQAEAVKEHGILSLPTCLVHSYLSSGPECFLFL